MSNRKPITAEGKKNLDELLKRLIQVERPKIIEAIKVARAHGDLSENADYDAAKEQQALLEGKIADITEKLANAQVIDISEMKSDAIAFGAKVTLLNLDDEKKVVYSLVGEAEADASQGLLSIASPLAKKMIGLKKGSTFILQTPGGEKEYEILKFTFG